ncbi:MAG: hypothetical protein AAFN77_05870 [Planctomycetota bacterium]
MDHLHSENSSEPTKDLQPSTDKQQLDALVNEAKSRNVKRRDFLRRAFMLGLSTSAAAVLFNQTRTASAQEPMGTQAGIGTQQVGRPTTMALGEEGSSPIQSERMTTARWGEETGSRPSQIQGEENRITTQAIGEEEPSTTSYQGEEGQPTATTLMVGEEDPKPSYQYGEEERPTVTTRALGEEGTPNPSTQYYGEEDRPTYTTHAVGEEGNPSPTSQYPGEEGTPSTTQAYGEEEQPTTLALGEEGTGVSTQAYGEEGTPATTQAWGEESNPQTCPSQRGQIQNQHNLLQPLLQKFEGFRRW